MNRSVNCFVRVMLASAAASQPALSCADVCYSASPSDVCTLPCVHVAVSQMLGHSMLADLLSREASPIIQYPCKIIGDGLVCLLLDSLRQQ